MKKIIAATLLGLAGVLSACGAQEYAIPAGPPSSEPAPAPSDAESFRAAAGPIGRSYLPCARDVTSPDSSRVTVECRNGSATGDRLVRDLQEAAKSMPGGWPQIVAAGDSLLAASELSNSTCDRPLERLNESGVLDQCIGASRTMQNAGAEIEKAVTSATAGS